MTDEDTRTLAQRLIDQHPAALRSVCWGAGMHQQRLHHLEIETKHGRVLVFDHQAPRVYCNPPRPHINSPQDRLAQRSWRDLTEQVPAAFDARPVITSVSFDHDVIIIFIKVNFVNNKCFIILYSIYMSYFTIIVLLPCNNHVT